MKSRNERDLQATEQRMQELSKQAQGIWAKADEEDRETTDDEKAEVEGILRNIETLKGKKSDLEDAVRVEGEVKAISNEIPVGKDDDEGEGKSGRKPSGELERTEFKSIGQQFTEAEGYQKLAAAGTQGSSFSTGKIALKATLFEGSLGSPGAGAVLSPEDRQPGIQQILFERLTVAALLAPGQTTSNVVRYVVETVADAGSIGVVAEGDNKPEAELEFDETDEPVRKIATFLPISDEMLEDAAQIRSYIDARLSLFVQMEEENQLLNGSGTGININGLLNRVPGPNEGIVSDAQAANDADHIFAALTVARRSFLEPDGIIVNPDDWASLRLLKDENNNYIGGSPFSNTGSEPGESLWNKRVVVTEAMAAGAALVGSFRMASQVFRRSGLTVEASNSHADYFKRNLTAIRAEERLALAVYRPAAFATADLSGS